MPPIRHLLRALLALALLAVALPAFGQERVLRFERVQTSPADAVLERAIADLLELRPGDPLDADGLLAARRRLERSGWFRQVDLYTVRGERAGDLVLRVEGELDGQPRLITGFGHDPLESWYLNVVGVRANHVLGPGSHAQAAWQLGLRSSMLRGEVEMPRAGGQPIDLLLRLRAGEEQWNAFDGQGRFYRQPIERAQFALGLRVHLGAGWSTTLWTGRSSALGREPEQVEGERAEPAASLVGAYGETERYRDLGLELTLDRRDLAQPWRRGLWAQLALRGSTIDDGGEFATARGALRWAWPLPAEQSLALRLDGRWSDRGTPYHLRPWFGGTGSVRGLRDASWSGGLGARATFAAGLEWRAPLLPRGAADPRVHGVLFVDAGRWVDPDGQWRDPSTSVGWGLRVRLPWVERLALDLAVPLTPTATDDPFWVHAGLGFGF